MAYTDYLVPMRDNALENNFPDPKTALALISALDAFRELNKHLEFGQAAALLSIYAKPGLTLKELQRETSLSKSAVSRIAATFGEHRSTQGLIPLIRVDICDDDARSKRVWPTEYGQTFIRSVLRHLPA